jgi:hypothetical protein
MKRKTAKRIVLTRETLRTLEPDRLADAAGVSGLSCFYSGCGHTCLIGCTLNPCTNGTVCNG